MRALLLLLLATSAASAQTGTIEGTVLEADSVTAVIGANVRVGGTTLGAATDLDGHFRIIGVPVGTYNVTASYAGYPSQSVANVSVEADQTRILPFTLDTGPVPDYVCVCGYEAPLIVISPFASRITLGHEFEEVSNEPCVFPWPRTFWGNS